MNENKFYHGGYVDTDIASKKATLNSIYGVQNAQTTTNQEELNELIIMLETLRDNIANADAGPRYAPKLTLIREIYPQSTKFVLNEAINRLKREVKTQPKTEWKELPFEDDDYIM